MNGLPDTGAFPPDSDGHPCSSAPPPLPPPFLGMETQTGMVTGKGTGLRNTFLVFYVMGENDGKAESLRTRAT
jgi:hypothetical protein